ncbi:hypothetical protein ACIRRH_33445 [Kitasatospora sp. NPDC101235]|uniref:hypothetical protein n=1 Tax=Kitasatospora sp. NPDC101235 TaxID=3364101 RepID=UPI00381172E4
MIAFDKSAIYGVPGEPDIIAVHLERDNVTGTIRAAMETEALVPLAERWLIARGADPEQLASSAATPIRPADPLTRRIEESLRSSGDRFTVRDSYTDEGEPYDIWVIAQDTAPAATDPVRVFHYQRQVDDGTYTVREGGFPDLDAAYAWTRDTSVPLPPVTSPSARATAARQTTIPTSDTPPLTPASARPPSTGRPRSR